MINNFKTVVMFRENTILRSFRILDIRDQNKIKLVGMAQISLGILDFFGVALIGLIGAIAVSGIKSETPNQYIQEFTRYLNISDLTFQTQIAVMGISAAIILIGRTLLTMYIGKKIIFFLSFKSAQLSAKLLTELLSRNITSLENKSSQETLYAVTTGIGILMLNVLGAAISIIADFFLLSILSLGLFLYDPVIGVLTLVLFSFVAWVLYRLTQKKVQTLGESNSGIQFESNSQILEVIKSFREIYVHDLQQNYANRISKLQIQLADSSAQLSFIPNISKYVIEITLVVGGVLLSAVEFLLYDSVQAVSTLALFLAATSRIAPAVLRVQTGSLSIKSAIGRAKSSLELIDYLSPLKNQDLYSINSNFFHEGFIPKIVVREATFRYSNKIDPAINKVSFNIEPGQQIALVGATGSGKSTLVDLMLGLRDLDSGTIEICGLRAGEAIKKWPGAISYVPQNIFVSNSTILQNIIFGMNDFNLQYVWDAIELAQLGNLVKSLPLGIYSNVGENGNMLSGGERQRLGIARALYTKPKLLILDEATSSLDAQTEHAISNSLSNLKGKTTLLIIAHRLSSLKDSDLIIYLDKGRIISKGSFEEVKLKVPDFDIQANLMGL
jgi:ATP-binding cassette subfamily C protein